MISHDTGMELLHFHAPDEVIQLAERLEGQIEQRACGRIRDLHVLCLNDLIILQGRSRTYHAKQIAQEAVLALMSPHFVLANQIVVS